MLRKLLAILARRRPPELTAALALHERAVDRSVAKSEQAAAAVRDITLNVRSAVESVNTDGTSNDHWYRLCLALPREPGRRL